MGVRTAFAKPEVIIGFAEEGRTVTGLFAGFSFVFFALPFDSSIANFSTFEIISLCVSAISSFLLIASAYSFSFIVAITKIERHQGDIDYGAHVEQLNHDELLFFAILALASLLLFFLSFVLVCFRYHYIVGLVSCSAPGLLLVLGWISRWAFLRW